MKQAKEAANEEIVQYRIQMQAEFDEKTNPVKKIKTNNFVVFTCEQKQKNPQRNNGGGKIEDIFIRGILFISFLI